MPTSSLDTRACAGRPRLQSGIPGPIADGPSHGRELVPGKAGGTATWAGSNYQAAILGNSGVRTSWVKANQAMAMRLPAMPP